MPARSVYLNIKRGVLDQAKKASHPAFCSHHGWSTTFRQPTNRTTAKASCLSSKATLIKVHTASGIWGNRWPSWLVAIDCPILHEFIHSPFNVFRVLDPHHVLWQWIPQCIYVLCTVVVFISRENQRRESKKETHTLNTVIKMESLGFNSGYWVWKGWLLLYASFMCLKNKKYQRD